MISIENDGFLLKFDGSLLITAKDMASRFGGKTADPRFALTGLEDLTVMADNVLPAVLRAKSVLVLTAVSDVSLFSLHFVLFYSNFTLFSLHLPGCGS